MKDLRMLFVVIVFMVLAIALNIATSSAVDQPGCPDYQPSTDQGTHGETPSVSSTTTTTTTVGQVQSTIPQVEGAISGAMGEGFGTIDSSDLSGAFDNIGTDNEVAIYTEFETPYGVAVAPGSTSNDSFTLTNTGNDSSFDDSIVSMGGWVCTNGLINIGTIEYTTSDTFNYSDGDQFSSPVDTVTSLPYRTSDTSALSDVIYLNINPGNNASGTCTGIYDITAVAP